MQQAVILPEKLSTWQTRHQLLKATEAALQQDPGKVKINLASTGIVIILSDRRDSVMLKIKSETQTKDHYAKRAPPQMVHGGEDSAVTSCDMRV